MTGIGPLLRRSSGPLFRRLLAAAVVLCAAGLTPAAADDGPAELASASLGLIELDLGYGFGVPSGSGFLAFDPNEGILEGLDLDHLIRRVLLQRALHERLLAEIDFDSTRNENFSLLGGNLYSLRYRGENGELLRELSLGNKYLSIPGTRFVPIDAGNPQTFALRASLGKGRFSGDALVRYGVSQEGRKSFRGSRRVLEMRLLDVDYARARFFLLPDAAIDEATLKVYRSRPVGIPDLTADGKPFALLARQTDYFFDNASARLSLQRSLASGEELVVTYAKQVGGLPRNVGDPALGLLAIIAETGARANFNSSTCPQYFDAGGSLLYLRKSDLNSYWEMRNAYFLEELAGAGAPADLTVRLSFTGTGAENASYAGLLDDFTVDPYFGALLFGFRDAAGFYPRPFPGAEPYPTGNPFAADNPIYGGLGYPAEEASVNTLLLRYTVSADSFFLEFDLVEGSVQVTIDGVRAGAAAYTVDYETGILSFQPGALGPSSEVEVCYRYTPTGSGNGELFAAARLAYDRDWLQAANLTTYTLPVREPVAPQVGEERASNLTNSTDLTLRLDKEKGGGLEGELRAGAALSLATANSRGQAIVADMEGGRRYEVSLRESGWTVGSRSGLLPAAGVPLGVGSRGELRYENLWEERLLGGDILHEVSWDNTGNPQFDYARKAGPYNSADQTAGGQDRCLVLDYRFPAAASDGYVSAVTALPAVSLRDYTHLNLLLRGVGLGGQGVVLYVELLQTYQEDLDGDDALDGELSSAQAGYAISPAGGSATVLGSDRFGQSNSRLDSEDLDGSGTLDPVGPFALDQEKGAVLGPAGLPALASVPLGDSDWQLVSLDLSALAANPATASAFQRAKALRLTVKPVSSPTAGEVSGRLLVNGVWFSAAGPVSSDSRLELREQDDASFSARYPEVYEQLHGTRGYRGQQGLAEKSLLVSASFDADPLRSGDDPVSISRRFAVPADFSPYREFRLYVGLPAGRSFPAEAGLGLEFLASSQEKASASFSPAAFPEGWSEVRVQLEEPFTIRLNGVAVGTLARTGSLDIWRTITEVRFTIAAAGGDLTSAFEFRLDEWHLRDSRWNLEGGFYGQGRIGFPGPLLSAGRQPLLSDPYLSGSMEWAQGSLADPPGRQSGRQQNRYTGALEARLLGVVPFSLQLSGGDARGAQSGTQTRGYSQVVGLDTGVAWLPTLEHSYQRTETNAERVALTRTEYVYRRDRIVDESLSLAAEYRYPEALAQAYSYSRSWRYEGQSEQAEGGPAALTGQALSLTQRLAGSARLALGQGELLAEARREDLLVTNSPAPPPGLGQSYGDKLASLFLPPEEALPGAFRSGRSDAARLCLELPRERYLGANVDLQASYGEWNAERTAGTRDASVRGSLGLALPFSPGGQGLLELTPRASRIVSGSFRGVELALGEGALLGQGFLPLVRPPLFYLNPRLDLGRLHEHEAVEILQGSSPVLGGSAAGFQETLGLEGRLRAEPWFLPSRAGVLASGETTRDGAVHAQKRKLRFTLGKDLLPRRTGGEAPRRAGELVSGRLAFDAAWEQTWDYTSKVRVGTLDTSTRLELTGRGDRTLRAEHTLRYARERQRVGDESLYLYPGQAGGELPVAERPDSDALRSVLEVHYLWEQPVVSRGSLLRSLLRGTEAQERIAHEEWLEVENQLLWTDRAATALTHTVPLRVALTHESRLTVGQGVEVGFSLKAMGGVEERIESGRSTRQPALGLELRLTARLTF